MANLPDISEWNNIIKKNTSKEKKEKISFKLVNEITTCLSCKKCKEIPDIIIKDKKIILLKYIKCGIEGNEKIENISNNSSKWLKGNIIDFLKIDNKKSDLINNLNLDLEKILVKSENIKNIKNKKMKQLLELLEKKKKDINLTEQNFMDIRTQFLKKINNEFKKDNDIIILAEVLFNTFRILKKNVEKYNIKYKNIFKIIINLFSEEEVRKFQQYIYLPYRNFLSISDWSINKDIELLKENIKTVLNAQ